MRPDQKQTHCSAANVRLPEHLGTNYRICHPMKSRCKTIINSDLRNVFALARFLFRLDPFVGRKGPTRRTSIPRLHLHRFLDNRQRLASPAATAAPFLHRSPRCQPSYGFSSLRAHAYLASSSIASLSACSRENPRDKLCRAGGK